MIASRTASAPCPARAGPFLTLSRRSAPPAPTHETVSTHPATAIDDPASGGRAWRDGERAAEHGQSLDMCPYLDGPSRDTWLVAWLLTHTRRERLTNPELRLD